MAFRWEAADDAPSSRCHTPQPGTAHFNFDELDELEVEQTTPSDSGSSEPDISATITRSANAAVQERQSSRCLPAPTAFSDFEELGQLPVDESGDEVAPGLAQLTASAAGESNKGGTHDECVPLLDAACSKLQLEKNSSNQPLQFRDFSMDLAQGSSEGIAWMQFFSTLKLRISLGGTKLNGTAAEQLVVSICSHFLIIKANLQDGSAASLHVRLAQRVNAQGSWFCLDAGEPPSVHVELVKQIPGKAWTGKVAAFAAEGHDLESQVADCCHLALGWPGDIGDPFITCRELLCKDLEMAQSESAVHIRLFLDVGEYAAALAKVPPFKLWGLDISKKHLRLFIRGDMSSPVLVGELIGECSPEQTLITCRDVVHSLAHSQDCLRPKLSGMCMERRVTYLQITVMKAVGSKCDWGTDPIKFDLGDDHEHHPPLTQQVEHHKYFEPDRMRLSSTIVTQHHLESICAIESHIDAACVAARTSDLCGMSTCSAAAAAAIALECLRKLHVMKTQLCETEAFSPWGCRLRLTKIQVLLVLAPKPWHEPDGSAWCFHGGHHTRSRWAKEALSECEKLAVGDPSANVQYWLSRCFLCLGRRQEAAALLDEAEHKGTGFDQSAQLLDSIRVAEMEMQRGQAALERGDATAEIQHFTAAIDAEAAAEREHIDFSARLFHGRSSAFLRAGRLQEAFADVCQSLFFDPTCLEAILHRGIVLMELGRYREACADFNRVAEGHPLMKGVADWQALAKRWADRPPKQNHYATLGVPFAAREADVKKAYKAAALRWHPDKNPECPERAEQKFKLIAEAFNVLSDPARRREYDIMDFTEETSFW